MKNEMIKSKGKKVRWFSRLNPYKAYTSRYNMLEFSRYIETTGVNPQNLTKKELSQFRI